MVTAAMDAVGDSLTEDGCDGTACSVCLTRGLDAILSDTDAVALLIDWPALLEAGVRAGKVQVRTTECREPLGRGRICGPWVHAPVECPRHHRPLSPVYRITEEDR